MDRCCVGSKDSFGALANGIYGLEAVRWLTVASKASVGYGLLA